MGGSLRAQLVKHLPAMQETWVRSLGREDPLEEGMATQVSTTVSGVDLILIWVFFTFGRFNLLKDLEHHSAIGAGVVWEAGADSGESGEGLQATLRSTPS